AEAVRDRPSFYALPAGGWRDYVTLLHLPYTAWHLSYVALGACVSSEFHPDRLVQALVAFALGLGVAAHALDEYRGRPLRTAIPDRVLLALAAGSLAAAAAVAVHAALATTPWVLALAALGVFLVLAYNLEWWSGRLHTDRWFAVAWGAFPAFVGQWSQSLRVEPAGLAVVLAAYFTSRAQRHLSQRARDLRRRVESVSGELRYADGRAEPLTARSLREPLEAALRAFSWALPLLALACVLARLRQV
ncbi:MAG: hypothetical protein ACK45F_08680, partial [bacterium]